jgi:hypothetical protein
MFYALYPFLHFRFWENHPDDGGSKHILKFNIYETKQHSSEDKSFRFFCFW